MSAVAELPQPIAGVSPPDLKETTIMTIWPSIAASGLGQTLGRMFQIKAGIWVFTVGNLVALLSIPLVLGLIMHSLIFNFLAGITLAGIPILGFLAPIAGTVRRYVLTNRRVMIASGLIPKPTQYVDLDRFDSVEVVVRPGQEWYPAGDLIFRKGKIETFQLKGVRRPETFRQTVMKAHDAYVGVKKATG